MFWELFFEHLRAAQRVLEAFFLNTLGQHAVFWKQIFKHCRVARRVLEPIF